MRVLNACLTARVRKYEILDLEDLLLVMVEDHHLDPEDTNF